MQLITQQWQGHAVRFRGEDAFVNLTEMCAAFGIQPKFFLRLPRTKEFIVALEEETGLRCENLTSIIRSGQPGRRGGGDTWAHPDLAVECARWLSPRFGVWCNQTIRRVLSGQVDPADIRTIRPGLPPALLALPDRRRDNIIADLAIMEEISAATCCHTRRQAILQISERHQGQRGFHPVSLYLRFRQWLTSDRHWTSLDRYRTLYRDTLPA